MEPTEYSAPGPGLAAIRGSVFAAADELTIKLEGSCWRGHRMVSVIYCDGADLPRIPDDVQTYGRNGTSAVPIREPEQEIGIIVEPRSDDQADAIGLAGMITHYMMHFGFPERKSTAGNLAYPFSPNLFSFQREDGSYGGIVIAGTRDPIIQAHFDDILNGVLAIVGHDFPEVLEKASHTVTIATAANPAIVIRTVDKDERQLLERHHEQVRTITELVHARPESGYDMLTPDLYEWTLFHLLDDQNLIKNHMFPIQMYDAEGSDWRPAEVLRPAYFPVGEADYQGDVDLRTLSQVGDHPPKVAPTSTKPLADMADVIRSKDAGVNAITFDILFKSVQDYQQALASNYFHRGHIAQVLHVPEDTVIGVYHADNCNTIKVSLDRQAISGSFDDRDGFGAQQSADLMYAQIPVSG